MTIRRTVNWKESNIIHSLKFVVAKLLMVVMIPALSALQGPNIDRSVVAVTTAVDGAAIEDELAVALGGVVGTGE